MKKLFAALIALVALIALSAFAAEPAQHQNLSNISGNTFVGVGALSLRTVTVLEHPVMLVTAASGQIPFASQIVYEFAVDRTPVPTVTANSLLQAIHNKDPWSAHIDRKDADRLPASNYTYKVTVTAATQRTRAVHRPMLS